MQNSRLIYECDKDKVTTESHLESPNQKLVLHIEEVRIIALLLKRLVDHRESRVILNILPATVAVPDVKWTWVLEGDDNLLKYTNYRIDQYGEQASAHMTIPASSQ